MLSKHVQALTLQLRDTRAELGRERERLVETTIEALNAPYPWPDQLLVEQRHTGRYVLYIITGALDKAAVWTAKNGEQILATREVE